MKKFSRCVFPAALAFSAALHLLAYCFIFAYLGGDAETVGPGEFAAAAVAIEVGLVPGAGAEPAPPAEREPVPDPAAVLALESGEASLSLPHPEEMKPRETSPRPEPEGAGSVEGRAGREAETAGPDADDYLGRVRRKIEEATYYPRRARLTRLEGRVRLGFSIEDDGSLREARLLSPSAHSLFNRAALEILEKAAPFPPPGPGIEGRPISVSISFESTY